MLVSSLVCMAPQCINDLERYSQLRTLHGLSKILEFQAIKDIVLSLYSPYNERSRFHWVLNFCWNSDTCAWATFLLFSCRSNCTYLLFSIVFKFLFSWINGYVVVCSEIVVTLIFGDYCCHLWTFFGGKVLISVNTMCKFFCLICIGLYGTSVLYDLCCQMPSFRDKRLLVEEILERYGNLFQACRQDIIVKRELTVSK